MSDELAYRLLEEIERNNELQRELLQELRRSRERVVNYTEAGRIIGKTRQTVSEYVAQGRLHVVESGARRGILVSELEKFT